MKKYLVILLCALVSCVGQKDDPDDTGPSGSYTGKPRAGIVMDFTATWCVNCPRMTTAIEAAAAERSLIPICVHFQDDLATVHGQELINHFGIQAYPSAVMNMDKTTLITATSKDLIIAKLDASSAIAPCTLEAHLTPDEVLTVKVTAAQDGDYTLSAATLQDGIVAPQTGASDTFVHNNVFGRFLNKNLLGDSLGHIAAGASVEHRFENCWLINTSHVAIFVCHQGTVNSAIDFRP